MYKVCFYSFNAEKEVVFTKHRTLRKAVEIARKMYVETGKNHYITDSKGLVLDRYGKPSNEEK